MAAPEVVEELLARDRILFEDAQHGAGDHARVGFFHAAHGSAHVEAMDDDGHPQWMVR